MKPLSPNEVKQKRVESIPDFVIEAANNLIAKKWDGYSSTVKLDDIVTEALKIAKAQGKTVSSRDLFDDHSLDIEPAFRKAGWSVKFDRPGYNESYDSYFEFTPKKTKG